MFGPFHGCLESDAVEVDGFELVWEDLGCGGVETEGVLEICEEVGVCPGILSCEGGGLVGEVG